MEVLAVLAIMALSFSFLVFVLFLIRQACLWIRSLFIPREKRKQFWEEIKCKRQERKLERNKKKEAKKKKREEALKSREMYLKAKAEREGKVYKEGAAKAEKNSAAVVIILIAIIFMWSMLSDGNDTTDNNVQMTKENKQTVWVEKSKDAVRARLKDSKSAQFKGVFFSDISGTPVACGQVNSKNSYGGYTGYQNFIAGGDSLVFLQKEVDGFYKLWTELCEG